jgi:signal recognition particle receptor subunit beta
VGAGKTTAINSITDNGALVTDVAVSDEITKQRKSTTTVALDYGVVKMNEEDIIHVYGTPGQERFDFMWDILQEGADGLIILLDNSRNYPYRDLKYYTTAFSDLIAQTQVVIAVTRFDEKNDPPLDAYKQWLSELHIDADISRVDARKSEDILALLQTLIYSNKVNQDDAKTSNETPTDNEKNLTAPPEPTSSEETTPAENAVETNYEPLDKIKLDKDSMKMVSGIKGVSGVTLTNSMGELLHTTINDDEMNEFIAFLSGITPSFEETLGMGEIHRIMLRGPYDDNITVFVENERSLGVSSDRKVSIPALSQQIEDMLQWV